VQSPSKENPQAMPAGEDASERYLPRLLLQLRLVDGDRVIVQGAVKCRNVSAFGSFNHYRKSATRL